MARPKQIPRKEDADNNMPIQVPSQEFETIPPQTSVGRFPKLKSEQINHLQREFWEDCLTFPKNIDMYIFIMFQASFIIHSPSFGNSYGGSIWITVPIEWKGKKANKKKNSRITIHYSVITLEPYTACKMLKVIKQTGPNMIFHRLDDTLLY
ncbi:hypothetical protein QE152_g19908 [Popillia japonica]|uniref:Uncharacterized protein n=1 Tax=Popillia japonica TaxID=7064 RepID=A0AAW1KPE4_POPJA